MQKIVFGILVHVPARLIEYLKNYAHIKGFTDDSLITCDEIKDDPGTFHDTKRKYDIDYLLHFLKNVRINQQNKEINVCNGCHAVSMLSFETSNFVILNI